MRSHPQTVEKRKKKLENIEGSSVFFIDLVMKTFSDKFRSEIKDQITC